MDLSITVINWNTSDLLVHCLRSVVAHGSGLEYELTVTDNASTDANVRQIAEEFPQFRWFFNTENTGGVAQNEPWKRIRGRYFLFLGPDAVVQPDCLQQMVRFLDTHPEAGAVSALLLNSDGSIQYYYRRLPNIVTFFFCRTSLGRWLDTRLLKSRFVNAYTYKDLEPVLESSDRAVEVEQPSGACFMMCSEFFQGARRQITDPRFPFYFGDVDLCKTVYDAGYRVFVLPSAKVIHHHGASFSKRETGWKRAEYYASLLQYLGKYYHHWAWAFRVYIVCETILLLGINFARLILAPGDRQLRRRIRELQQVLSRVATLSR